MWDVGHPPKFWGMSDIQILGRSVSDIPNIRREWISETTFPTMKTLILHPTLRLLSAKKKGLDYSPPTQGEK